MTVKSAWIRYGAESHAGYFSYPARAKTPLPAVLVFQEAWGVNAHIEDVTRRFALAGYAALAPDLFSKGGDRPAPLSRERLDELVTFINEMPPSGWADVAVREGALAKRPAAEGGRIRESLGIIMSSVGNLAPFLPPAVSASEWLREECEITRGEKVFSVGFCLGGGLSLLLACHEPALAAAVAFYGSVPSSDIISKIQCPVMLFAGDLDTRIHSQIPSFAQAMKDAGKRFDVTAYKGVGHAFFNDDRPTYDAVASRDAFVRTLSMFRSELN